MLDTFHLDLAARGLVIGVTFGLIHAYMRPARRLPALSPAVLPLLGIASLIAASAPHLGASDAAFLAGVVALTFAGWLPRRFPNSITASTGVRRVAVPGLALAAAALSAAVVPDPMLAAIAVAVGAAAMSVAGATVDPIDAVERPAVAVVVAVAFGLWLCLPDTESSLLIGTSTAAALVASAIVARKFSYDGSPITRLPAAWGAAGIGPLLAFAIARSSPAPPTAVAASCVVAIGGGGLLTLRSMASVQRSHSGAILPVMAVLFTAVGAVACARWAGVRATLEEAQVRAPLITVVVGALLVVLSAVGARVHAVRRPTQPSASAPRNP